MNKLSFTKTNFKKDFKKEKNLMVVLNGKITLTLKPMQKIRCNSDWF